MSEPEQTPRILRTIRMRAPDARGIETMVSFVLAQGAVGDYAVYMGVGDPEWVRAHGNKLHFEMAETIFRGIERERYRE